MWNNHLHFNKTRHLFCQRASANEATQQGCFFRSLEAPLLHRPVLCRLRRQNPVRIPRPKVGELAHQTQGVGIFAVGEIPTRWRNACPALFGRATHEAHPAPRAKGVAESGPHIRLSDRCPLARHRERRDIFAKGEIPGTWCRGPSRTPVPTILPSPLRFAPKCAIIKPERRWSDEKKYFYCGTLSFIGFIGFMHCPIFLYERRT